MSTRALFATKCVCAVLLVTVAGPSDVFAAPRVVLGEYFTSLG